MPPFYNDLLSVLPAAHPKPAPLPAVDSQAPTPARLLAAGVDYAQPTVLAFVRHCGCPFAEAEVKQCLRIAQEQEGAGPAGIRVVVVTMADADASADWFAQIT